jgi:hypothetical protein
VTLNRPSPLSSTDSVYAQPDPQPPPTAY